MSDRNRQRVALCYPFFPHYRGPVCRQLLEHAQHDYVLLGDLHDPGRVSAGTATVKAWDALPDGVEPGQFVRCPVRRLGPVAWQMGAVRAALSSKYDVLILFGHAGYASAWVAAILGRLRGKRILFWTHGWRREDTGLKKLIRVSFYKLAHGLLLYGHWAKMIALNFGLRPENLHVIYNSLDVDAQRDAAAHVTAQSLKEARELFNEPDRPLVFCSGRLDPGKRLDLLIDAAAQMAETGTPVNLLLVGDGEERAALQARAESAGVNVHFYGACYEEKTLAVLIQAADVVVLPGAAGLTVMHALAYGTPIVTNDDPRAQGPEFEAVRPGQTGATFSAGSVPQLTAAIASIVDPSVERSRDSWRAACIDEINTRWNPEKQRELIDRAVAGLPADDTLGGIPPRRQSDA